VWIAANWTSTSIRYRIGATPQTGPSLQVQNRQLGELVLCGTLQTLAFGHVADAASVCICGTFDVAAQRKSPKQPLDSADLAETETVVSPQLGLTTQTRMGWMAPAANRRALRHTVEVIF
jgi:hypothetical protein